MSRRLIARFASFSIVLLALGSVVSMTGLSAQQPVLAANTTTDSGESRGDPRAAAKRRQREPLLPLYVSECGDCHVPYAPRFLPASSWQQLMTSLPEHFGSDASLSEPTLGELTAYLVSKARKPRAKDPDPAPLRITEMSWWLRQHDEISERRWKHPRIPSRAACDACHAKADEGRFGHGKIPRMPKP